MVGGSQNGKVNGHATKEINSAKETLITPTGQSGKQPLNKRPAERSHIGGAVRRWWA